jgi:hypothetical protein
MDPRLLDYYNQELLYTRELAGEFAQMHPKIARRLGMQAGEMTDPYVERLIESFSFMAARMQLKLDAEFPRFTGRLLEVIYPNYVAPTPSMAVARFFPSPKRQSRRGVFCAAWHGTEKPHATGRENGLRIPHQPGRHAVPAGDYRGAAYGDSTRYTHARPLCAASYACTRRIAFAAAVHG